MAFGASKGRLTANAASITNPTDATGSVAVVVGDLVYVVVGEQTSVTVTAVTDNLGNTYAATQAGTDAGTSTGRAFWSRVTIAGTLTTAHVAATASSDNVAIEALVVEGPFGASPLDANPTNIVTDVTSPFTCPATGTLAQASEVVIAWGVATGSTAWAATSPNVLSNQTATATVLHTVIGFQTVAATTTVTPEFTAGSNPTDAVLGTTSFRAAASGPGALADAASSVAGAGTSSSTGTGALASAAAAAAGVGLGSSTQGALVADAATLAGVGVSEATGTGALAAQVATVSGAGTSQSIAIGALVAGVATILGAGLSRSTGTGSLTAQAARVSSSIIGDALPNQGNSGLMMNLGRLMSH